MNKHAKLEVIINKYPKYIKYYDIIKYCKPKMYKILKQNRSIEHVLFWYACDYIQGRWPEAEPYIMLDPKYAYKYARWIIHGRWPEIEPIIMKDAGWAYYYTRDVIRGRWPEDHI